MEKLEFTLPVFEGPLELLLHLIQKNKVSLYDIPISEITEQYMEYLEQMNFFDIEISSEFLVIAANLLYIKSKTLLPKHDEEQEEEDPRLELAQRLILYKRFKKAAAYLSEREAIASHTFYKPREYIEPILIDESLSFVTLDHLHDAIADVAERLSFRRPLSAKKFREMAGRESVSVFSKVKAVLSKLKILKKIKFLDIFKNMKSRDEVVASFLAVLELIKVNRIAVEDNNGVVEISYLNKKRGRKDLEHKKN